MGGSMTNVSFHCVVCGREMPGGTWVNGYGPFCSCCVPKHGCPYTDSCPLVTRGEILPGPTMNPLDRIAEQRGWRPLQPGEHMRVHFNGVAYDISRPNGPDNPAEELARLREVERRLMDIDWCIGYELTVEQMEELDDIRSGCYKAREGEKSHE